MSLERVENTQSKEELLEDRNTGFALVVLGLSLYLLHGYFLTSPTSPTSDFLTGCLLGLSVSSLIFGIIYLVKYFYCMKKDA